MGKFDGLPDLPADWLELLQAETVVLQRNMPADPTEAAAKAQQEIMAEQQDLQEKCPQVFAFLQVSREAVRATMVQSGIKEDDAVRFAGLCTLSTLALLRMLAISTRTQKSP